MRHVIDNLVKGQAILQKLHDKNRHEVEKLYIIELHIRISRKIYMQKLNYICKHVKNASAVIFSDLKKGYI